MKRREFLKLCGAWVVALFTDSFSFVKGLAGNATEILGVGDKTTEAVKDIVLKIFRDAVDETLGFLELGKEYEKEVIKSFNINLVELMLYQLA